MALPRGSPRELVCSHDGYRIDLDEEVGEPECCHPDERVGREWIRIAEDLFGALLTAAHPEMEASSLRPVNPPVDAPKSATTRPRGSTPSASSAPASFTPPRDT